MTNIFEEYHIYIRSPDGKDEFMKGCHKWLRDRGCGAQSTKYNWRELEPNQCAASHGYLEGAWFRIQKIQGNRFIGDPDPSILILMKLTFG